MIQCMVSRLTFIRHDHIKVYTRPNGYKENKIHNLYQCSCGNKKVLSKASVESKAKTSTWSCGCIRKESIKKINDEGRNIHKTHAGHQAHNTGKIKVTVEGVTKYISYDELVDLYTSNE